MSKKKSAKISPKERTDPYVVPVSVVGAKRPKSDGPDKNAAPNGDTAARRRAWRLELAVLLPALILGATLYLNAVHGDFVYDDQRQIVRNSLIQDPGQVWRALTSDVWAFKGSGISASNYWRPTFVAWMILNFRLFGVDQALPWHITNIILNLGVIILAFAVMRRLKLPVLVAGAIAAIFAAHPAHTESVAWISGSPDLLMAAALLGSLWFVISIREKSTGGKWFWALLLYAVALGAKEVAIFYPIVVFAVLWRPAGSEESRGSSAPDAVSRCAPFVVFAIVYFLVRIGVLGQFAQAPLDAPGLGSSILSIPAVFAFYLRQIVFPLWVGPAYGLRAVTGRTIGLTNFFLPVIISLVSLIALFWMARRSLVQRVGLALFLITLAPAMNIGGFLPEQLVHDRYLYLPLLGFLMVTIPELARLAKPLFAGNEERGRVAVFGLALLLCAPLGFQTVRNNRAWLSNLALWTRSIETDPNSSWNYQQYGAELLEEQNYDQAIAAYDRSIAINPNSPALMGRGRGYLLQGKFALAEADFESVIVLPNDRVSLYPLYQAYEGLAITYEKQNRLDEAVAILRSGRQRLNVYAAAMTEKLSVILYRQRKKPEALKELELYRAQAKTETLPESKIVLMRLGALYAESNRREDARTAFQEYLKLTEGLQDPQTIDARKQTTAMLQEISK